MSVTFKLGKDARFHDGTPVTTTDVKCPLDRAVTVRGVPIFQMKAGSMQKPEPFVVVVDNTFCIDCLCKGQAALSRSRRPDAVRDQFRAGQAKRHGQGPVGGGLAQEQQSRARSLSRQEMDAGQELDARSRIGLPALRRLESRPVAQD
jgi:hypothetical protein